MIEKFLLLTAPRRAELSAVESLFQTARTALALIELERCGTIKLVPADATRAWDYRDPLIRFQSEVTPDTVGLNTVFEKLKKFQNKKVSAVLGHKNLDPLKAFDQEFARQGILQHTNDGYRLVATDVYASVVDHLGLVLRGQRRAQKSDSMLLEVVEAINASVVLLGSVQPEWSRAEFSEHIHRSPSGHPVVTQLVEKVSGLTGLMEQSKLSSLPAQQTV